MTLHTDDTASYYVFKTLDTITMEQLNVIMLYGIGSALLIILPIIVISAYEMKQIKQSQGGGVDAIITGIAKVFIYSVFFLFFVMLVLMVLIGMSTSHINPAFGIDWFFHTEWLDSGLMPTLDNNGKINTRLDLLEGARSMVAILAFSRMIYIGILMGLFIIFVSFSSSVVVSTHRKMNEASVLSFMGGLMLSTIVSILVFWGLMGMVSEVLNSLIWFSDEVHGTNYTKALGFNVINDLVALFNIGRETLIQGLNNG